MNRNSTNRIEQDLLRWPVFEERFRKLFPEGIASAKVLQKEKLRYYDAILVKKRDNLTYDERFARKLVQHERRRLQRQIYPNVIVRMFRRLVVVPLRSLVSTRRDKRKIDTNTTTLTNELHRRGLGDIASKVEYMNRQEHQQFSVPTSYYKNDKERLDYDVTFSRNQNDELKLEGYRMTLRNDDKPGESLTHFFGKGDSVNEVGEAYNLLCGRSVQKDGRWLQLDLNDKDAQGNFRLKEFRPEYGYSLENTLKQLPIKESESMDTLSKIADTLNKGGQAEVTFLKNGVEQRYIIEANPQFKSINIYDSHHRKVSLASLTAEKKKAVVPEENKQQNNQKKSGRLHLN